MGHSALGAKRMGILIIDGAQAFGADLAAYARRAMAPLAARAGVTVPALNQVAGTTPRVPARINHNRLIADCPDCGGAEFVWRDGPHILMCQSCWNGALGHKWRRVALPDNLPAIERVLLERPVPQTRNWQLGETVDDLRRENQENLA